MDKEIQLVDLTHNHAQKGSVEFVKLTGKQFDRGLVDGFMKVSIHDIVDERTIDMSIIFPILTGVRHSFMAFIAQILSKQFLSL